MTLDLKNRPQHRKALGITYFLIAAFFMALIGFTAKIVVYRQTPEAVVFWRNLTALVLLFPWIVFSNPKEPFIEKLKPKSLKINLVRAVSSFLSVLLYFYSLQYLDLSIATLLWNTIPIFVPIIAYFWKRIAIQHVLWWGIGIAFLGICFVLNPFEHELNFASIIALAAGVSGAFSFISLRLGHYSESQDRMLFYLFFLSAIFSLLASLIQFEKTWGQLNWEDFGMMVLLGVFSLIYQVFLSFGSKNIPIRLGSVFIYFAVIFAMIFDVWVWKESIPLSTYIGFLLIVLGSGLMIVLYPKDDLKIKHKSS